MTTKMLSAVLATILLPSSLSASSYYPAPIDDARAVYLTSKDFPVRGDGTADDSDAIQQAINKVQDTTNQGILFIPAGHYRLTKTIYIWPGIRVIGFGAARPVFVLAANTPGFQQDLTYLFFFAGFRPGSASATRAPGGETLPSVSTTPPDANPGTFYSAMSNIDIEIRDGNPGAVGVRAHYAQHCFLAHMDFHIGSGLAGIHEGGNVAQDVHFYGGRYGIWTRKPSPGWQFTVIDATFENQREAAIREHEAGLTLIRPQFKNVPTAISIDPKYSDELWVKDARMENISGPAVVISNENNSRTEINMENVVCRDVPVFVAYRESGKKVAGQGIAYAVKTFSHGLHFDDIGLVSAIRYSRSGEYSARAGEVRYPRLAADEHLGEHPELWGPRRWLGRRHGGFQKGNRREWRDLPPVRPISCYRHNLAQAGHGVDRLAPKRHADCSRRLYARFSGRRKSQTAPRDTAGRHKYRDRPRLLYERYQPACRSGEVDGWQQFAHERCALPWRARYR